MTSVRVKGSLPVAFGFISILSPCSLYFPCTFTFRTSYPTSRHPSSPAAALLVKVKLLYINALSDFHLFLPIRVFISDEVTFQPPTIASISVTVTVHSVVLFPSAVVTVIVAVPAAFAVTFPSLSTVAIAPSLLLHVTFLLVAFAGATFALSFALFPFVSVSEVHLSDTPVTGIPTVTVHVAVLPPSFVVTVIVAVPADFTVTFPSLSTVAIASSLLLHVTLLLVAFVGATVAVSFAFPPAATVSVVLSSDTPVTATFAAVTVTLHSAFTLPLSFAVAVTVASPAFIAVTVPSSTVTTLLSLVDHVTD